MLNDFDKANINQQVMNTICFLIGQRSGYAKNEEEVCSIIKDYIEILSKIIALVQLEETLKFGEGYEQAVSMIQGQVENIIHKQIDLNNLLNSIKEKANNPTYTIH